MTTQAFTCPECGHIMTEQDVFSRVTFIEFEAAAPCPGNAPRRHSWEAVERCSHRFLFKLEENAGLAVHLVTETPRLDAWLAGWAS